jgi:hypothetical protein
VAVVAVVAVVVVFLILSLFIQVTSGVSQGIVLVPFLCNVFINDLCNSINHCTFLIFADDIKIFHAINSSHDYPLLQPDINSFCDWCATNSMRLTKTCVTSYSRKTVILRYEHQLCHAAITCTSNIKELDVFFGSKLYFQIHVDFIFSECISY